MKAAYYEGRRAFQIRLRADPRRQPAILARIPAGRWGEASRKSAKGQSRKGTIGTTIRG